MGGAIGLGSILSIVGSLAGALMSPSAPSAPAPIQPPPPPAPAPLPPPPAAPPGIDKTIDTGTQINSEVGKSQAAARRRAEQQKQLTVLNAPSNNSGNGTNLTGE